MLKTTKSTKFTIKSKKIKDKFDVNSLIDDDKITNQENSYKKKN